jgi:hypothetical protein
VHHVKRKAEFAPPVIVDLELLQSTGRNVCADQMGRHAAPTESTDSGAPATAMTYGSIFDRSSRFCLPVDVCFASKADLRPGRSKTRPY